MEVFWIPHLSVLVLLHQTTSARSTTKVIRVLGGSVTFRSHNPDRNVALWSFGDDPIVTVVFRDSPRLIFFEDKFEARFAISKNGHALIISQLRMEDAGNYSVTIDRKTSTFTLQVFSRCSLGCFGGFHTQREVGDSPVSPGELAEPTVTCEAQNCSDGSCSSSLLCSVPGDGFGEISYTWRVGNQLLAEGPVLLVNESLLDKLELLTCRVQNPVSSRNVIVTAPGVLCAGSGSPWSSGSPWDAEGSSDLCLSSTPTPANTTHPPSSGAHSSNWVRIGVIAGVEITVLLSMLLVSYCKSRG